MLEPGNPEESRPRSSEMVLKARGMFRHTHGSCRSCASYVYAWCNVLKSEWNVEAVSLGVAGHVHRMIAAHERLVLKSAWDVEAVPSGAAGHVRLCKTL